MGFLIFAYRKLFLKRKVSDLQFRQMQLSMNKQQMAEQIGQEQQGASFMSGFTDQAYQSQIGNLMRNASRDVSDLQKYQTEHPNADVSEELLRSRENYMSNYQQIMADSQSEKMNSNFYEQSKLRNLKNQDVQIDQEMASIESQLKLMSAELESVEKGEDKAAKEDAPKFGLS